MESISITWCTPYAWPGKHGDERWFLRVLEKENDWNAWAVWLHCNAPGAGFNAVKPGTRRTVWWRGVWKPHDPTGAAPVPFLGSGCPDVWFCFPFARRAQPSASTLSTIAPPCLTAAPV